MADKETAGETFDEAVEERVINEVRFVFLYEVENVLGQDGRS